MGKWYVENHLGLNSPFLLKNVISCSRRFSYKIDEKECAKVIIKSIETDYKDISMKGYIKNENSYRYVDLMNRSSIITTSCFDEIYFYFYVQNENTKVFACKFNCCGSWGNKKLEANEILFFGENNFIEKGQNKIKISVKIENLREGYHYYNGIEEKNGRNFNLKFLGDEFKVTEFQCIFCLKKYERMSELKGHINHQHLYFNSTYDYDTNTLIIEREKRNFVSTREFMFVSKRYKGRNAQITEYKNKEAQFKYKKIEEVKSRRKTYEIWWYKNYLIKVLQYELKSHNQIEKEYRSLDFTTAVVEHVNGRLKEYMIKRDGSLEVMECWNRLKIEGKSKNEILEGILEKFGLNSNVLKLFEILYTQGVLNSIQCINILNKYEIGQSRRE